MTIIQIDTIECGQHQIQSQSGRQKCWKDGYIEVPDDLESDVWETLGWCDLTIEDGCLIGVTPTERPILPEKEPEPTETERLRADLDYLAALGGVFL